MLSRRRDKTGCQWCLRLLALLPSFQPPSSWQALHNAPEVQAPASVFQFLGKQSWQGDNVGFNMIYRIGVKGDHQSLQSVDVHFTVSSLLVVFRSGLCLQKAEVTGEKPAFHSRQKKAVGYLGPGKDKHGLKTVVNQSLAFAHWEQESRLCTSLHPSECGTVCGSGWGDLTTFLWRCIFNLEKDEKPAAISASSSASRLDSAAQALSLVQP